MKILSSQLLMELRSITFDNIEFVESILEMPHEVLNLKLSENCWSILECIEHLNLYGNFYISEIDKKVSVSGICPVSVFNSGIIGNYIVKKIIHRKEISKMKAPDDMNPSGRKLDKEVLNDFLRQQEFLLELLNKSKNVDLNRNKTAISISKRIRLRLGDTFRFVIYHNQRHIEQAKKNLINLNLV